MRANTWICPGWHVGVHPPCMQAAWVRRNAAWFSLPARLRRRRRCMERERTPTRDATVPGFQSCDGRTRKGSRTNGISVITPPLLPSAEARQLESAVKIHESSGNVSASRSARRCNRMTPCYPHSRFKTVPANSAAYPPLPTASWSLSPGAAQGRCREAWKSLPAPTARA